MEHVLLALGSNLGDRLQLLRKARRQIDEHPDILVQNVSPVFETEPVGGPAGQNHYLNAVLELSTSLSAGGLLSCCQQVEERCGRIRGERWGPRSVDLDILFYGKRIIRRPELSIPHPLLHERRFVLVPLVELVPDLVHPVLGRTCRELLDGLPPSAADVTLYIKDW